MFRIATLWALNEIHLPSHAGRWLQRAAQRVIGAKYALLQQSKAGEDSRTEGEGLLTRHPPIETANLDYRSHNCVALAARFEIDGRLLDVYVTHLIAARVEDAARQYQVNGSTRATMPPARLSAATSTRHRISRRFA